MARPKIRHRAREAAFQILYRYDLDRTLGDTVTPQGAELEADLDRHFDHFDVPADARGFAAELVRLTLEGLSSLDEEIEKHASRWKVARMAYVDRNLLRMGTCEMRRFGDEIPASVTIDEAIELAKQFGTAETAPFVNGILDAISRSSKA